MKKERQNIFSCENLFNRYVLSVAKLTSRQMDLFTIGYREESHYLRICKE
jgi:hypothetical protein